MSQLIFDAGLSEEVSGMTMIETQPSVDGMFRNPHNLHLCK